MKVYQIISEAPPVQKPSARIQARQQTVQTQQQAAAQAQTAQQQAAAQAKAIADAKAAAAKAVADKASADSSARRKAHAAKGIVDKPPKIVRDLGRYARQNKIRYDKNTARAQVIEKSVIGKAGAFGGWLLKWFGILEPARELWNTVTGLEDDFKNGLIYNNGQPMTAEDLEAERNFAYGVFETQILLPLIARGLINTARAVSIARAVKNVAATVSAPATAGLSIGAALATEAGLTAFALFLGSNTAQNFMADNMMSLIKGGGWIGTSIVDGLWKLFTDTEYAKELEKDKATVQNKKALDTATTPQARQSAQQAIDTAKTAADKAADMAAGMKDLK